MDPTTGDIRYYMTTNERTYPSPAGLLSFASNQPSGIAQPPGRYL